MSSKEKRKKSGVGPAARTKPATGAKRAAVQRPAVKRPAVKRAAAKPSAVKRPAVKPAAVKRAVKRPVLKRKAAAAPRPSRRAPVRAHVDAVLTEIVRNGALAVTEEMKTNLMRTAYNMIIYEALDFTVGLFTAEGETVSIGLGLPSFIRGMSETIKAKLDKFGVEGIEPGDILVTNDAYTTGSHLHHFTFSLPIFHSGKLSGWACCMAHWPDVGGVLGGVTTDIYSEGLQIPILKYQKAGVINDELVEIIRMNVRIPERAMGDLRAQITAVKTGERRFLELLDRYGREPVLAAISKIMDQSEVSARARTRTIPDGVYEAESFMDDDGVDIGKRIPIKVRVIKKGDEMTIDLTEVGRQVRGFYNSGPSTGYACAQVAYKCLTSPTDYPINEGSFRALKVKLAEGSVVSAVKPAAMRWWMTFPMTIVDTVFKAMAEAIPDRSIAAHHADLAVGLINGISPKDGRLFIASVGPCGGGWGAKINEDGMSAVVCMNDGDTHNSPVEQLEAKLPILFERHELREDSGGAGRFRGGLGTVHVVQARAPINFNIQVDRMHCAPWGIDGGLSGAGNQVALKMDGKEISDFPNAKVVSRRLKTGDGFVIRTGGGGGFGPPHERDPERVAHDVRQGYVSREVARNTYGVEVDAKGDVDLEATEGLRTQTKAA
jgi:N-methylhydantoinase B